MTSTCGFTPLYNDRDSMKIFRDIDIRKEETPLAYLIQEALLEKAPFEKSGQNLLSITPVIKNSYGVITTENEITRYSVTLDVEYSLDNKETTEISIKNNVSATSDYEQLHLLALPQK